MTGWDRLFAYFPLLMFAISLGALGVFAEWPSIWTAALFIFVIYFLPPYCVEPAELQLMVQVALEGIDRATR